MTILEPLTPNTQTTMQIFLWHAVCG